jgi:hypothetical protein
MAEGGLGPEATIGAPRGETKPKQCGIKCAITYIKKVFAIISE